MAAGGPRGRPKVAHLSACVAQAAAAKLSIAEGAAFTYLKGCKLATAPTAAALLADVRTGGEFRAHGSPLTESG